MNKQLRLLGASLLLGFGLQTTLAADLSKHPGFLNLDTLPFMDGKQPSVEVTLSGPVLKMLLQLPIQYDEQGQVQELLQVVDQILVRVYTLSEDQAEDTLDFISATSETLERDNWQRIVRVREDEDESVDIHVKLSDDGENLNGLVIMAIDSSNNAGDDYNEYDDDNRRGNADGDEAEVVFVNITGNFNPAHLANIGKQFDIEQLEGVEVPTKTP